MPGETAEQWRGEGTCERVPLENLMDRLPHYTITAMVSSKRIEKEKAKGLLEQAAFDGVRTVVVCDVDTHYLLLTFFGLHSLLFRDLLLCYATYF